MYSRNIGRSFTWVTLCSATFVNWCIADLQCCASFRCVAKWFGEGNGTPLQYSCLENPMDRGACGLPSIGLLRVGHDWATSLSPFTFMHWRRKWQPTPVFLPGESQGRGSLWAAIYGVAQSRTQLKRLSSSSSSSKVIQWCTYIYSSLFRFFTQ